MTVRRHMFIVLSAAFALCAAPFPTNAGDKTPDCMTEYLAKLAPSAVAYVGLYNDVSHYDCDVVLLGGFMPFDVWVWFYGPSLGIQAAEYRITAPANVIPSTVTTNPNITVSLGDILNGISVAFGPCQSNWVWTHRVTCYLTSAAIGYVRIEPSPAAGALQIATCELGYPIYPVTIINHLAVNQSCLMCPPELPSISGVTLLGQSQVRAQFNMCVKDGMPPTSFALRNKANALDSIAVTQASRVGSTAYDLGLESSMIDGTTYVLAARLNSWSCSELYPNQSEIEFTYVEATAVERTSWGAIKSLYGN